jgi:glyoxylase-like metal-dependent hydrolase (beta-lactamase superfamily II)
MGKYLFLSLTLIITLSSGKYKSSSKHFNVEKLTDGVWAVIHNDKSGYAICNAGIVDLGDKTLVFDAFINPDAASDLKNIAKELTGKPVSLIINSHYHDDHVRGNQAFNDGIIISTAWTKAAIARSEPEDREWAVKNAPSSLKKATLAFNNAVEKDREEAALWVNYYKAIIEPLPRLKLVLPAIGFTDSLHIEGSKRSVILKECKNAHTSSDAIMILPKEGIAFMGDMLFTERHPFLGHGDPATWKRYLENLFDDRSLKHFVPGHGPVAGKESLQSTIGYISYLQQEAHKAVQNREPDSIFAKRSVPAQYSNWWYKRFYPANLRSVYKAATQ